MKNIIQRFSIMRMGPMQSSLSRLPSTFKGSLASASMAAALAFASQASAVEVSGCPAPKDADFEMTTLASQPTNGLAEPLRMAFDMSADGVVDIYFVEKAGKVRKYDGASKTVTTLGTISVRTTGEHGLLGIAMDPAFKTNKRLYLFYGSGSGTYEFRLSRFTLNGAQLDMGSEKIMLRIPADNNSWHTGGALMFDKNGDLYISVGDNKSDEGGSPNTNSYLGKILRIHPKDDGTYSIPDGNLFPAGTDKTKPEIYIMGNRNPYSLAIDPKTNWLGWGEVGPDGFGMTEEWDIATKPGNYGWPYFAGNNMVLKTGKVPSAPTNNSTLNTGLTNLPIAVPATVAYPQGCAITGPIYRYGALANTPVKMPPHFDGMWFVTDFNNYGTYGQLMDTMSLDANGKPGKMGRIWPNWKLSRPTEMQVGPDGAFYIMNYSGYFSTLNTTAIVRISYKGTCRPDVTISVADRIGPSGSLLEIQGSRVSVGAAAQSDLKVRDMNGRTVYSERLQGMKEFDLAPMLRGKGGVYAVSLASGANVLSRKVVLDGL
jgi:glucose/arabinose dehydrogenase